MPRSRPRWGCPPRPGRGRSATRWCCGTGSRRCGPGWSAGGAGVAGPPDGPGRLRPPRRCRGPPRRARRGEWPTGRGGHRRTGSSMRRCCGCTPRNASSTARQARCHLRHRPPGLDQPHRDRRGHHPCRLERPRRLRHHPHPGGAPPRAGPRRGAVRGPPRPRGRGAGRPREGRGAAWPAPTKEGPDLPAARYGIHLVVHTTPDTLTGANEVVARLETSTGGAGRAVLAQQVAAWCGRPVRTSRSPRSSTSPSPLTVGPLRGRQPAPHPDDPPNTPAASCPGARGPLGRATPTT